MKHKTAALEGALLDAAVAKAEGMPPKAVASIAEWNLCYSPSTDGRLGATIIERERIDVGPYRPDNWRATPDVPPIDLPDGGHTHLSMEGPTMLCAAMRAYVASKFGDEVDLP